MTDVMAHYNEIIKDNPLLNADEEKKLAKAISRGGKRGQQARERLFNSNVRLVIRYATKVHATSDVPLEDLLGEGNIGLMKAIDKFNPEEFDTRFSTYAHSWIQRHVNNAIIKFNSRVHVPQNILIKSKKYLEIIEKNPDISRKQLKKRLGISETALQKLESYKATVVSLETPIGGDKQIGEACIGDMIEDQVAVPADRQAIREEEKAMLFTAMNVLDDMQKEIIERMYLAPDQDTLEVIGKKYGVSKERIRQRKNEALKKMRFVIEKRKKYGE